jgi:hypothetical protein
MLRHLRGNIVSDRITEEGQVALAAKAMALKEAGAAPSDRPPGIGSAADGFKPVPRPDYPPSGAFDAEGHRPVLERSRKER